LLCRGSTRRARQILIGRAGACASNNRRVVLLLLGRECIQEGFIEDAVGVLEDCVRIDPRKVEPHLLLGEA